MRWGDWALVGFVASIMPAFAVTLGGGWVLLRVYDAWKSGRSMGR